MIYFKLLASAVAIVFAITPTLAFKFPSTDFIKRGFFHCFDGKNACTKRSDLCTNQNIFDECYEKCISKRRTDAKTPLIIDQLLKCPTETILKSRFSAQLELNANKYGKKFPKPTPKSITEKRRDSIKQELPKIEPATKQTPIVKKRRDSIIKQEPPKLKPVIEQKPVIKKRRDSIKKELPKIESMIKPEPIIEKQPQKFKQVQTTEQRQSNLEPKRSLAELKDIETKKGPHIQLPPKVEQKPIGKTWGRKETHPSKPSLAKQPKKPLPTTDERLIVANELKRMTNLPAGLQECVQKMTPEDPDNITNTIRKFGVKSGGGTQSKNFAVCDDSFVQLYRMNNFEISDRKAAEHVLEQIKDKPSYNAFIKSFALVKGTRNVRQFRDIGVYPKIKAVDFTKATPEMLFKLGAAFAQLHKDSVRNGQSLSYEDLQPSNFLYTENEEVKFIDYGGLALEPIEIVYKRIREFVDSFITADAGRQQFLKGYQSIIPEGLPETSR